jgi:hydroxyethylthiazole kinase-like uncharacterized protein yjeF
MYHALAYRDWAGNARTDRSAGARLRAHNEAMSTPPHTWARPLRISGSPDRWPLHDAQASRLAEQAAQAQHAPHALMRRAGWAVARLALALAPHAARFQVWAGPGNNGGDGLVAARLLHQAGRPVHVSWLGDAAHLPADAAHALATAQQAGVPLQAWSGGQVPAHDLAIDALLGLGAARPPAGALAAAIEAINAGAAPVLAVDIPSGLHPDSGSVLGSAAVRAQHTLGLLSLKPGCHTGQGRDHAGDVWWDALGVDAGMPTAWLSGAPARASRQHAAHKGSFGDVAVVGGAPGMAGAAWLAARAALAAGAGRVYCSLLDDKNPSIDTSRPELMTRAAWWRSAPALMHTHTVVCGCGGGSAVAAVLPPLLAHAARLVLDADALNAVAADATLAALLQARRARGLPTLLTPHPLEAARLLATSTTQVQADRMASSQALAELFGATVLLKGSGSVIASAAGTPCVNPTGNAALATAGTGDVLAGWAAGLWAQTPEATPSQVAVAAAWWHGRAADMHANACPGTPLRASDLIDAMVMAH